jgi:hypothetical protein
MSVAVTGRSGYEVRAGEFYDLYAKAAEDAGMRPWSGNVPRVGDPDEPLLSSRDFGLVLQSLGYEPDRDEDGRYYIGLSMLTREERADRGARQLFAQGELERQWQAVRAEHLATADHGVTTRYADWDENATQPIQEPRPCEHDLSTTEYAEVAARSVEKYLNDRAEEIAELRERVYGPYLRWQRGDPLPEPEWYRERMAAEAVERAELEPLVADIEAVIAEARQAVENAPRGTSPYPERVTGPEWERYKADRQPYADAVAHLREVEDLDGHFWDDRLGYKVARRAVARYAQLAA